MQLEDIKIDGGVIDVSAAQIYGTTSMKWLIKKLRETNESANDILIQAKDYGGESILDDYYMIEQILTDYVEGIDRVIEKIIDHWSENKKLKKVKG